MEKRNMKYENRVECWNVPWSSFYCIKHTRAELSVLGVSFVWALWQRSDEGRSEKEETWQV
jgi:hypothetical protein